MRVGSGPRNQIVIHDDDISREHAEIKSGPGGWKIVDLESVSGTKVNGNYVNQQVLQDGDRIEIGSAVLTFDAGTAGGGAPRPVAAAPAPAPAPAAVAPAPVAAAAPSPA
ncbi:MAG: FHA domain-containing protein, partial [Planctomycetota bacterium]